VANPLQCYYTRGEHHFTECSPRYSVHLPTRPFVEEDIGNKPQCPVYTVKKKCSKCGMIALIASNGKFIQVLN